MRGLILAAALAVLLTGCGRSLPKAREMDDMALMRAMGVDAAVGPGQVEVTLSSSRRARGIQGEEEPPLVLSAKQPSVRRAMLAMQGLSDSYVFCGHVDQLLLGEEVARRGVGEALGYFARDRQLGLGAQVWLIRGAKASDAIGTGKEKGVDTRLSTLQNDGEIGTAGLTRTVGETLTALLEDGSAYLPALELSGEEEGSAALLERGYAVLKGETLAGFLTGDAAKGLELAQGRPEADLLELDGAAVRVRESSLNCVPLMEDGRLRGLELDLRLTADTEERGWARRQDVERHVEETELRRLLAAVEQLQEWNADCLALGRRVCAARPEQRRLIWAQWAEVFPELEVRGRCTVSLTGWEQ